MLLASLGQGNGLLDWGNQTESTLGLINSSTIEHLNRATRERFGLCSSLNLAASGIAFLTPELDWPVVFSQGMRMLGGQRLEMVQLELEIGCRHLSKASIACVFATHHDFLAHFPFT